MVASLIHLASFFFRPQLLKLTQKYFESSIPTEHNPLIYEFLCSSETQFGGFWSYLVGGSFHREADLKTNEIQFSVSVLCWTERIKVPLVSSNYFQSMLSDFLEHLIFWPRQGESVGMRDVSTFVSELENVDLGNC